jgi:hypothetical protein
MPQSDRVTEAIDTAISVFFTWQMLAAYVLIQGAMQALKRATIAAGPGFIKARWYKVFIAVQNYWWGLVVALPHGFLIGETYGKRAIMGLVAGTLSHVVYRLVLKRFEVTNPKKKTEEAE